MSQMTYKTGSTAVFKTQPNKIKPTKKALKKTNTQLEVAAPKKQDQDSKKQKVEIWSCGERRVRDEERNVENVVGDMFLQDEYCSPATLL